jgi:hypothetical protein
VFVGGSPSQWCHNCKQECDKHWWGPDYHPSEEEAVTTIPSPFDYLQRTPLLTAAVERFRQTLRNIRRSAIASAFESSHDRQGDVVPGPERGAITLSPKSGQITKADLPAPPTGPPISPEGRTSLGRDEMTVRPKASTPIRADHASHQTEPAGSSSGQMRRVSSKSGRVDGTEPERETHEEKNQKVRDYLSKHPRATSGKIGKALGYPEKTVRGLTAWKVRAGKDGSKGKPKTAKERSLTRGMQAVIPGRDDDPAKIGADQDEAFSIARARYMDTLDDRGRAEFNGLNQRDQEERVGGFLLSGADSRKESRCDRPFLSRGFGL